MLNDKFVNRTLQMFIRFLKEEKIIGVFNRNFSMYLKNNENELYVKYGSSYNSYVFDAARKHCGLGKAQIYRLFLDYAMTWNETEKGFEFWQQINAKWKQYFFKNLELIKKETNEK